MALTEGSSGSTAGVTHLIDGDGSDAITLPPEISLSGAGFERVGDDLVVAGPDGAEVVIRDFFLNETPPDLFDAAGGYFAGAFAAKLAGSVAPAHWAQAGDVPSLAPIGTVDSLQGAATSTRVDGSVVTLDVGDPVFADDLVSTAADSAIGIVFVDGTVVSLGGSSRIVLDELVYDPGGASGALTFSVVEGVFVFVSGAVAKTGPDAMVIETPVASIGIRGTVFGLSYDAATGRLETSLMPETDPVSGERLVGEITVRVVAPDGTVLAVETINVVDARVSVADSVVSRMPVTAEDTANQFGPAATPTLGDTFVDPSYLTPGGERGQDREGLRRDEPGDRTDLDAEADPLAGGMETLTTEAGVATPADTSAASDAETVISVATPSVLSAETLEAPTFRLLTEPIQAVVSSSSADVTDTMAGAAFPAADLLGIERNRPFVPEVTPSRQPASEPSPSTGESSPSQDMTGAAPGSPPSDDTEDGDSGLPAANWEFGFAVSHVETVSVLNEALNALQVAPREIMVSLLVGLIGRPAVDDSGLLGKLNTTVFGWTYSPNGAFDDLAIGESMSDSFVVTTPSILGGPYDIRITVTVTRIDDTIEATANPPSILDLLDAPALPLERFLAEPDRGVASGMDRLERIGMLDDLPPEAIEALDQAMVLLAGGLDDDGPGRDGEQSAGRGYTLTAESDSSPFQALSQPVTAAAA
ncbi:MAG: hypothetical protein EA405_09585 [Rhodospirillales bacterium]|nr:MAG: hypothetical protein EA405_09585 [Rhodospirillales bacterium]